MSARGDLLTFALLAFLCRRLVSRLLVESRNVHIGGLVGGVDRGGVAVLDGLREGSDLPLSLAVLAVLDGRAVLVVEYMDLLVVCVLVDLHVIPAILGVIVGWLSARVDGRFALDGVGQLRGVSAADCCVVHGHLAVGLLQVGRLLPHLGLLCFVVCHRVRSLTGLIG